MSTDVARKLASDLAARIKEPGPVAVRRYFGGSALVADGVQFGIVMGNRFYLRVDDRTRVALAALGGRPFRYQGRQKEVEVDAYYEVPDAVINDPSRLMEFVVEACRAGSAGRRVRKPARLLQSVMRKGVQ